MLCYGLVISYVSLLHLLGFNFWGDIPGDNGSGNPVCLSVVHLVGSCTAATLKEGISSSGES